MYKQPTSADAGSEAEGRLFFYHGDSMRGTFRPGDRLTVLPASFADLRPGDVAVFRGSNRQSDADLVVHRVMAVGPDGLVTRGDNAPTADNHLLIAENLVGRAACVERDGCTRPVRGGRLGLWRARALHARRSMLRLLTRIGRLPYRWLRASGLVQRLWRPTISRICLNTERGPLVKYVCGGRTVACWQPEQGRFDCRKPYDLVINKPTEPQAGRR